MQIYRGCRINSLFQIAHKKNLCSFSNFFCFQDEEAEDEDEEFQKAYNCYIRSMNNEIIVDSIEIPDDDDNDGDCQIVLFHDISDDDDDTDVIFVPTESVSNKSYFLFF